MRQPVVHLTLAAMLALAAGSAQAQNNTPLQQPPVRKPAPPAPPPPSKPAEEEPARDGPVYDITSFLFRYATDHPDRPPVEDFLRLEVTLSEANGVLSAPGGVGQQMTVKLEELASNSRGARKFSVSAINAIGAVIVKDLNARGLIGVLVSPDPTQIDPQTLHDLRPAANRSLTLDIWTRTVKQVRTLGQGERWARPTAPKDLPSEETRINSKYHERIRDNSPLQPGPDGQPGDLLRKDVLDDYLFRLNRHAGRRVDAAVAASDSPGDVVLDYIVTENRPWTVYFQLSNTGTEQTNNWRERLGFTHNQLLNKDDTLSIDFITASLDTANAVTVNYDSPFGTSEVIHYKLFGSASEYTASDVGFADEKFKGDSWNFGAELSADVWQRHQSFIDVFAGIRYEHEKVNNEVVQVKGQTAFFIPYLGARFERGTEKASTNAEIRLEHNFGAVATDEDQLNNLGRLFVDRDWTAFKWDASTAFFLEPLLHSDWANPNAPYKHTTLAHEVALSLRGQWAFGHRLIPQEESTVGGLYSVRGYDESAVAGDNAVIFSAEYRYHVPRAMAVRDPGTLMGKPFRWAPDQRYGRPDWDLVLKGFTDMGRATNSDIQSFEKDSTLWSVGVGAELLYQRNVSVRMDWGLALHDAANTQSGDSRLHLVATFLY